MVFDLFMTILTQCEVEDPGSLWEEKKDIIAEKFFQKENCTPATASAEETRICYQNCLREIKKLLAIMTGGDRKRTNEDFDIPEPDREETSGIPKIILAEKAYDVEDEDLLAEQYAATLNSEQRKVIHFYLKYCQFFLMHLKFFIFFS